MRVFSIAIFFCVSKSDDPRHPIIIQALEALVKHGVRLCYTSRTLAEFWNACTRPRDKNGFGLSVAETDRLARVIERDFEFLPDSRETHERWRELLVAHDVHGVQVHDAKLASSMYIHNVGWLLTINVRGFRWFERPSSHASKRCSGGPISKHSMRRGFSPRTIQTGIPRRDLEFHLHAALQCRLGPP